MKKVARCSLAILLVLSSTVAGAAWDGVLDWAKRTEMSTASSGVIARVLVQAGERVKEKTVLLQLEQATLRARVKQSQAELQHAKLLREEAERQLNRSQELYDRTLLADHDLNIAKLNFAEADAAYQRARANRQAAEEELSDSMLLAPFDAIVLDRLVQPSQTVINQLRAEPMLVLASSKEMLVRFTVKADEVAVLTPGKKVNVVCEGDKYQGIVESIRLDNSTGHSSSAASGYAVEVVFPIQQRLFPGTAASVSLP